MTSGGVWTYTLNNNNPTVQALNAGASLTDTFTITTTGGTTQVVTITIAGADDAPIVSGDASAALLQGLSTTITTADLSVADLDNTASQLTFNVSSTVHGYVALASAPGVAISSFTQVQLAAGQVIFVNDATQNPAASFTVTATDGSLTTAGMAVNVAVNSDFVITSNVDLGGVSETIHSLSQSGGTLIRHRHADRRQRGDVHWRHRERRRHDGGQWPGDVLRCQQPDLHGRRPDARTARLRAERSVFR